MILEQYSYSEMIHEYRPSRFGPLLSHSLQSPVRAPPALAMQPPPKGLLLGQPQSDLSRGPGFRRGALLRGNLEPQTNLSEQWGHTFNKLPLPLSRQGAVILSNGPPAHL